MPTREADRRSQEVFLDDALPAGEAHVGEVGTGGTVVDVAPVTDAAAYGAGDVLFTNTEVAGAVRVSGGSSVLDSVVLLDLDDQAAAVIDLYFLRANSSIGVRNSVPDIDDTEAQDLLGWVSLLAADFKDLGTSKIATKLNVGLIVKPTTGTSIWVAGVCAGTPTQTAAGIKLRLGFRYL